MKFSYNWLQTFFDDPLPPAPEVAERVGLHMFELEEIEELSNGDVLIDWDILPNRSSDCMSYRGIAGEISAICNIPLKEGVISDELTGDGDFMCADYLTFDLETDAVLRATKRIAVDVVVGPSPDWLRGHLESIGQNSINNVVDITNYVMWMTGQPVHAFDYDKLAGNENDHNMTIRHAHSGEKVTDLTEVEHTMDESMLVVADSDKALDVAGIKGGNNSGVDENTKRIVISACNFDFKNIRKTSRTLKLRTDASARYENEVPIHKAVQAQIMAGELLAEHAGARLSVDIIDTHTGPVEIPEIVLNLEQINSVLGLDLDMEIVVGSLEKLQFSVEHNKDSLTVIPSHDRPDVTIVQDVIEEVGRMYGYYNVPAVPLSEGFTIPQKHKLYGARDTVADILVSHGFYETLSRTLTDGGVIELANPLTSEAGFMRTTLMPFLETKVSNNFAHTDTPHFFEIGKVFTGVTERSVDEHWSFAGVLGRRKIKDKQKNDLFLQTKGVLETVFETLHIKGVEWKEGMGDTVAILEVDGDVLGSVGVNWWEINFDELVDLIDKTVEYTKPSKYPKMDRDVAVWVPMETRVQDVRDIIESAGHEKCIDTQLFDVFEDSENDRKSVGFRLVFQCNTETLSDDYTNGEMDKVYKALKDQPGFEIR